jgi:RNA recognition motif-containing protein
MAKKLFVGSLPWATTSDDLKELFSQFGEVTSATIIIDKMNGRSRGFGFVEMSDDAAADAAIDKLNGSEYQGRTMVVNEAKPMEERSGDSRGPRRSFGGGGDRSGGRNDRY